MRFLITSLLELFDKFHKKKILNHLRSIFKKNIDIFFDVGSHRGESIKTIIENFNIKEIHAFEPSPINFEYLVKNISNLNVTCQIYLNKFGLGNENVSKKFKQMKESSSSTFNEINEESLYFKKKNLLLNLGNNKNYFKEYELEIKKIDNYIYEKKIKDIDFLKIDTEGFEYFVLKGFENHLKIVKVILFEHHYDLMLKKNYKFSDINNHLKFHNFKIIAKLKMPFRKSFEYIYINNS
mgnify:CR=1 FL=1